MKSKAERYAQIKLWQQANPEKLRGYSAKWRRAHHAEFLWYSARKRARHYGLPFTITVADVRALLIAAKGRCPALGVRLRRAIGKSTARPASHTLDRISPRRGYVPGNVVVLSRRANSIKNDATASEILAVARWLRKVAP